MKRTSEGLQSAWLVIVLLAKAGVGTLRASWGMAAFSLASAVVIWAVVQDVENPRDEGTFPLDGGVGISIAAENVPDGYILRDAPTVRVRVEARKDDLPTLRASDFRATVDMQGAPLDGETTTRTVRVESRRDGVEVLDVEPREVQVALVAAAEKQVNVEYRLTGGLPEGYRIEGHAMQPAFVTVYGLKELVDLVASVQVDVNLSGVRVSDYVAEGELVARNASGNALSVRLLVDDRVATRGSVAFEIEEVTQSRTMTLLPNITGDPAPGYRIAGYTIQPATVVVTGPADVLRSLTSGLPVAPIDVTNATADVEGTRDIEAPNVVPDVASARVRVSIVPIQCGESTGGSPTFPCQTQTVIAAVSFTGFPAGIQVSGGPYTVPVRVKGSVADIAALRPGDVGASINLSNATLGTALLVANATAPPGVTVIGVDAIPITLVAVAP
ncbi:MAG: CdaR family protein [Tepidiformaceae bacterium]